VLPNREISKLYTPQQLPQVNSALNNALYAAINGNWVLGNKAHESLSSATLKTLQNNLINTYTEDYMNTWQQWLSQTQVRKFGSLSTLEQAVQILTQNHSPLEQILAIVQQNTVLNSNTDQNTTGICKFERSHTAKILMQKR
jgi:type VI protein secretion system component VasK